DIGSPRADDHEHLMLPEMLEDPYVEVVLQAPPSPDYFPGPEHVDDEIVAEDQPYAKDASPIALSPEYVPESDFEAHPKDDDDEDHEEDPLPSASRKEHRPEVTLPPRKRLDIALGPRYEVGESSSAAAARPAGGFRADYGFVATVDREIMCDPEREVGYEITDSWDEIVKTLQGAPVSTDTELGGYVREFEMRVRQDTDEIYMRLDDEQTERQLLAGDIPTGTGDSFAGTGYHFTETAGTCWRSYIVGKPMAPRRTTRLIANQETVNATTVTNALLQAMIDQGVTAALAARDALRSTNGDDSHNFETGVRRTERATRECTYTNFLKCQPLPFKGTEGVASLSHC
nr:hypothetical protein [Tanacetum cinerariifolium]